METFVIYLIAAVVVVLGASLAVLATIIDVMFLVANCAINSWQWVRGSKAHAHSERNSITELVSIQKPPAESTVLCKLDLPEFREAQMQQVQESSSASELPKRNGRRNGEITSTRGELYQGAFDQTDERAKEAFD